MERIHGRKMEPSKRCSFGQWGDYTMGSLWEKAFEIHTYKILNRVRREEMGAAYKMCNVTMKWNILLYWPTKKAYRHWKQSRIVLCELL